VETYIVIDIICNKNKVGIFVCSTCLIGQRKHADPKITPKLMSFCVQHEW
jgi:hypothetical protein